MEILQFMQLFLRFFIVNKHEKKEALLLQIKSYFMFVYEKNKGSKRKKNENLLQKIDAQQLKKSEMKIQFS